MAYQYQVQYIKIIMLRESTIIKYDAQLLIHWFRKMGVKLALTMTPFISTSSSNFLTGVERGLFIREPSRELQREGMDHDDSGIGNYPRTITPALTSYKVF